MDRKNTLLLTVIAIATLLVAVVGATFAFFTAQNNGKAETPVNVKTETTNSLTFDKDSEINIHADITNFSKDQQGGEREQGTYDESNPSVTLQAGSVLPDGSGDGKAKYCYAVNFVVTRNEFGYSKDNLSDKKAELVFKISKKANGTDSDSPITQGIKKVTYSDDSASYEDDTNVTYKENIITIDTGGSTQLSGWDFTAANPVQWTEDNTATGVYPTTPQTGYDEATHASYPEIKYAIPKLDTPSPTQATDFMHEIEAEAGQTVKDEWKIEVTLVNHPFDQERNANRKFTGKVEFISVDCQTGLPPKENP